MDKPVLEVKNLTKKFGRFTAVDDISFSMEKGEILGFLGPNGAGKTTTISMLLGVLTPTSGEIRYFDKNLATHREEILEKVNFSSTYTNLPWYLTVKENLTWVSYLYNIKDRKKKVMEVIEVFKLEEVYKKSIGQLSAGQLTRVNLAKSFLNSPSIMLLDEPTASLDPDVAEYIRAYLLKERERLGISVVFTSHNMAEVEEICDRVVFINKGKIIANDTPEKLAKTIEISHIELRVEENMNDGIAYLKKQRIVYRQLSKKYVVIDIKEKDIPNVLRDLMNHNIIYDEISIEKPTLEDYFLQMAKEGNANS